MEDLSADSNGGGVQVFYFAISIWGDNEYMTITM